MASRYAEHFSWLKKLLDHIDFVTRESAARLMGITCSVLSVDVVSTVVGELLVCIRSTGRFASSLPLLI